MATIDSVKLPDNSTYDLTDNYSGYAKKVASATTDDLASLTATGDLADSGKKLSDLVLKSDVKDVLNSTSTTDPLSANMGRVLNENVEAIVDVYGAKNLLPYPWYETTKTANGLTFTDNGDGTLTLGTGTASADTYFEFCRRFDNIVFLQNGTYLCTGCPSGVPVGVSIVSSNTDSMNFYIDSGNGVEMPINGTALGNTGSYVGMGVEVKNGTVISTPITFKPMLRDARILDNTFVPFAKTNLQLTNDKAERSDLATLNLTGSTNSTGSQIDEGTYFYLNGSYCKATTNIGNGATFTLNTNFETVSVGGELFKITPRYITQIAVSETRSLTTELPRSYIIATYGSIGSALTIQTGVGYGKESSRHKTQSIVSSSDVVYAVNDSTYGLDITNNTSTALTVSIIKLL